jgi:CheY-like chemotaxis protein
MNKQKSILLIDDDVTSNFISELVIKKLSIFNSVRSAKNGKEALDFILDNCLPDYKENCPQIIFLDLHMPVMDGFDFLEHLTLQMPHYVQAFKIFILTSSSNPKDMEMAGKYKIDGYVVKPLNAEKVKELID